MKSFFVVAFILIAGSAFAVDSQEIQNEIKLLRKQTKQLEDRLNHLQKQLLSQRHTNTQPPKSIKKPLRNSKQFDRSATKTKKSPIKKNQPKIIKSEGKTFRSSPLMVHVNKEQEVAGFYPTALIADGHVISYIAGTPVVTAPYLGARPAFDGSDYIVNISSINRDIRLMEQRRRLYRIYERIGYPKPKMPIIALSGKAEPVAMINRPYMGKSQADLNLGSSEIDVAAALNENVEAFISVAYDETPPPIGQRVDNSAFSLNLGFINIGNLDKSPLYFTAGQLFVPFGRYSSSMISSSLPLRLARTKSRPVILGYKSQCDSGPYAAVYGFKSDTNLGHSGIGGLNLGYTIQAAPFSGNLGFGFISSITDSTGMQDTGSTAFTTFGGFASPTNGSELIHKIPGIDFHGNLSFDRYNLTAEWVGSSGAFRARDLSFNGRGARPQAGQLEAGLTFMVFRKPASLAVSYQWSKDSLALNLPKHRYSSVFNISIWRDTIESLEYRHDVDYATNQFGNGIPAPGLINLPTFGTGRKADALIAQIGVFF